MEQVHLPQCQIVLREGKTFHYKVLSKLYRNSELNFLVNFDLILSALKKILGKSNAKINLQNLFDLTVAI